MSDQLEDFIRENRHQLDLDSPPGLDWKAVKPHLPSSKSRKGHKLVVWQAAAGILLLICAGLAWQLWQGGNTSPRQELGDISTEYRQLEKSYQQDVANLQASLGLETIDREAYAWLFEELDYLEELNATLKPDLNKRVDEQKLVRMLVDYYEKKLKLLRKLELELNRTNHEKRNQVAA